MNINFDQIGEQSDLMPILVHLYDAQQITGLAENKDSQSRSELTSIVTSLLEMNLSPRESELVADVLISLMRQVGHDLCLALSERLSVMPSVPLRLALHIANEAIDIASPMLKRSAVFNDMDLTYIIKSKPAEYWRVIAQRETISAYIINLLADTQDVETAITLAENRNIYLSGNALDTLVQLAQGHKALAEPLLYRDEITEEIVKKLYKGVSIALKTYIRDRFDYAGDDILSAVDDIVEEFLDVPENSQEIGGKTNRILPQETHIAIAQNYKDEGALTIPAMMELLKRGQYRSFLAQFSAFLDLPPQLVGEVLLQETGEALAGICKAVDISKNDFISIFLLASRLRTKGTVLDPKDLVKTVRYYNRARKNVALDFMQSARDHGTSLVKK